MDVLHLYSGNLFGGVERTLVTLAAAAPNHRVALSFDARLAHELREVSRTPELLGEVRFRSPVSVLRARWTLDRLLRRRRPDAVVCHSVWSYALFASRVRSAGLPLAIFLHDLVKGRHWLERLAARHAPDVVFANSALTAECAARLFSVKPVIVHPPLRPRGAAGDRDRTRASLGVASSEVVVMHASRMVPLKGHPLLLEALSSLPGSVSWRAWLVGGPRDAREEAYFEGLRARAAALSGRVQFLGERSDVPELLDAADVYCQPNQAPESFGLSFCEAMQAGLPVVTTKEGAASGVVDDGCALVVPAQPGVLAGALTRVMQDPALRLGLGEAGRRRAAALGEPAACARSIEAAFGPFAENLRT